MYFEDKIHRIVLRGRNWSITILPKTLLPVGIEARKRSAKLYWDLTFSDTTYGGGKTE